MSAAALDNMRRVIAEQIRLVDASYAEAVQIALRIPDEHRRMGRIWEIVQDRNEMISKLCKPLAAVVAMLPPEPALVTDPVRFP